MAESQAGAFRIGKNGREHESNFNRGQIQFVCLGAGGLAIRSASIRGTPIASFS